MNTGGPTRVIGELPNNNKASTLRQYHCYFGFQQDVTSEPSYDEFKAWQGSGGFQFGNWSAGYSKYKNGPSPILEGVDSGGNVQTEFAKPLTPPVGQTTDNGTQAQNWLKSYATPPASTPPFTDYPTASGSSGRFGVSITDRDPIP